MDRRSTDSVPPNRAFGVKMEFRILGPVEVWEGGRRLDVGGPKPRAVLAAFLLHADRMVSTDRLIDELWGETPPATARNVLQCHVARLRRALHRTREGDGSTPVLLTRPGGYLLRVEPGQLDLHRFQEAVESGRRAMAAGDVAGAAEHLRRALAVWRGPALADIASESLRRTTAPHLEEARLVALEERLDADLGLGRHAELVGELEALVAAHPDRERPRRQLMLALYRSGRPAEALEAYRAARRRLVEEFGLEPSPALQQLERDILLASPGLDPESPPAIDGDEPRPAPSPGPCQLPPDIDDFTGREVALAQVQELLEGEQATAIVISAIAGKAGVGKTALAVRVAHRLRPRFADGQLYVNLRGAEDQALDPADVLAGFLRALGVEGAVIPEELEERVRLYRSRLADRRVLVVLDNAASEAQVRPLLPGSRGCAVLVTSRARLGGLEAAHSLTLDVLDPEQAVVLLARLAGPERVATEPEAARQIVRLCGWLPLAVRIAGARVAGRSHWRLALLVERLADEHRRLDELVIGDLEVRASVALSYRGRGEQERRLFRLLGLLVAPHFPAWVAATLLDIGLAEAEELLERLVDAQLVEVAGQDQAGQLRYRLHDLLRVYASERLRLEEPTAAQRAALERMLQAYLALAEQADALLEPSGINHYGGDPARGPRDHPAAAIVECDPLGWLEAEHASLVAAVDQGCDAGIVELGWRLATALVSFFGSRAHWDDWQHTHTIALAAVRRMSDREAQGRVLGSLADLHMARNRFDEASCCLEQSLAAFRETGNRRGELQSLTGLGGIDRRQGRFGDAVTRLEQSLSGFREIGWHGGEAEVLFELGEAYREQGRAEAAVICLEESVRLMRAIGDRLCEAPILRSLALTHCSQGRFGEAIACLEQSLALTRASGDQHGEAYVLQSLGDVHRTQGRLEDAESCLEPSLALARATGDRTAEAYAMYSLGEVRRQQSRLEEAAGCLEWSLAVFRERGLRHWEARTLKSLGVLLVAKGEQAAVTTTWQSALAILRELDMPEAAEVAARLGDVHPLQPADGQGQGGQGDQGGQDGRADRAQPGVQAEAAAVEDGGEHALGVAADGQRRRRGGDRDHRPLPEQGVGQADQQGPGHQQRQQHPEGAVGEGADHGGQQHPAEQVGRPEPAGGDHVSDRLGR
jgi:DNA-binding SARP family transcriptional activator